MKWTDEMKSFFNEYTYGHHYREILEEFNQRFPETPITMQQVKNAIRRYHLNTGFNGRFRKGQSSPTKGKPQKEWMSEEGIRKSQKTRFKNGGIPPNHLDVGTEVLTSDGYYQVKIAEPNVWKLRGRLNYEAVHGEIPDGYVVMHVDGNTTNDDVSNLELMTKSEVMRLNSMCLCARNEEINRSAITIVRLQEKISEASKQ